MKTIYNKISNIINSMLEKVGYHFVGYKVDIYQNQYDISAIRKYKVGLHEFKEFKKEVESNLVELKKVIDVRINMLEGSMIESDKKAIYKDSVNLNDVEDNNLDDCANDVIKLVNKYHYLVNDKGVGSDNEYFVDDVKRLISKHINSTDWVIKNDDKIATLESRIENLNSICKVNENLVSDNDKKIATLERINKQYERLLTSDNNYILEEIAKILCEYDNVDSVYNKFLYDIIDDINDKFNEFTNIYHDVYEDDNSTLRPKYTQINNNINLTNERG